MRRQHRAYGTREEKRRNEQRIYSLVAISAIIIVVFLPLSLYRAGSSSFLDSLEGMDSGQIARNMARGAGMTTNIIRPDAYRELPHVTNPPDLSNPPLYIWLCSHLPSLVRGNLLVPPDRSLINCSSFFYVLSGLLLFFFARDIAGAQGALMVMLIYLCNVPLLNAAAAGTRYTLVAAAVTSFFMLLRRDRNESFLYSFVLGSVAGVCYLAAYAGLFLLVPLVMFKLRRRKYQNGRHLLMAFAGFMLVAGPWMIRLLRVGGNPLWGQSLGALFLSSPSLPVAAGGIGARLYLQLALWYATLISIYGGGVALAFFLISPLVRCGDPAHEECKLLLWSALLPVAAASLVGDGRVEIFTAFVPLMLLWGVQAFNEIIAPRPESAKRLRVFFVAVNCIPFLVVLTAAAHPGVRAELWGARIRAMADMHSMMHTGDIVMTNAPEWLAYYGEFNTLPLPRDEEELAMWEEEFGGLGFAVVCPYGLKTPLAQSMLDRKRVPEWFIAERALVYPQGERFFSVNAAGGMAAGGIK